MDDILKRALASYANAKTSFDSINKEYLMLVAHYNNLLNYKESPYPMNHIPIRKLRRNTQENLKRVKKVRKEANRLYMDVIAKLYKIIKLDKEVSYNIGYLNGKHDYERRQEKVN